MKLKAKQNSTGVTMGKIYFGTLIKEEGEIKVLIYVDHKVWLALPAAHFEPVEN